MSEIGDFGSDFVCGLCVVLEGFWVCFLGVLKRCVSSWKLSIYKKQEGVFFVENGVNFVKSK